MKNNSVTSSYLIDKNPTMYGGRQDEYRALANTAVEEATAMMRSAVELKEDVQQLFFRVFDHLRDARKRIASKHTPEKAHLFGTLRTDLQACAKGESACCLMTPLSGPYREYNRLFLKLLQNRLDLMDHGIEMWREKTKRFEETVAGRVCSFEVAILERSDLETLQLNADLDHRELQKKAGGTSKSAIEIESDIALMRNVKSADPALYKRLTLGPALYELNSRNPFNRVTLFPNGTQKSVEGDFRDIYVLGTLRLEIEGKMYAMSRYLTWLDPDGKTDPVGRIKRSNAMIIHQDPFLNEATLKEISQMFEKAVLWNRDTETLATLKERVALLRFTYAQCTPCARGDGAIGDWLELAIYRFHGFAQTHFNDRRLPCFEALTWISPRGYLEEYKQITIVENPLER